MSLTWKDLATTISIVLVALFTLALLNGFLANIEARWALGSFIVFLFVGLTGIVTGMTQITQRTWSRVVLQALSASALIITLANIFFNLEVLFIILSINMALLWIEFVGVGLFRPHSDKQVHIPSGGAV